MNHLIFVEGVSGVGKTTTTVLLCDKLKNMGYKAVCYLEGDNNNPLDPFNGKYPPPMPLLEFYETYLQCWRNYVKNEIDTDTTLILDGTLLHHQINDLIREYKASDEVIANHFLQLMCVIKPLKPIIIYLSSEDIGYCLLQASISRKQPIPTDAKIAFWEDRKRVDLYVLERLSVESYMIDIDVGWDIVIETMMKCISIKALHDKNS